MKMVEDFCIREGKQENQEVVSSSCVKADGTGLELEFNREVVADVCLEQRHTLKVWAMWEQTPFERWAKAIQACVEKDATVTDESLLHVLDCRCHPS